VTAGSPTLAGSRVQRELKFTRRQRLPGRCCLAEMVARINTYPLWKLPTAMNLDSPCSEFDPTLLGVRRGRQFLFLWLKLPVSQDIAGYSNQTMTGAGVLREGRRMGAAVCRGLWNLISSGLPHLCHSVAWLRGHSFLIPYRLHFTTIPLR
jgi:hypothetical protein